ncbi:MAG: polyketide cyclase [Rhodospirillales bacterium 69-11]|nr:nuclear transport factor 2 family protein [Rhodospirillales bacterium]MBN8930081.1 nuclear transport factor 2 family protein [Rhodospirillales bacterium]OJW24113.1 MAG: polyketide cyclase [Rhodospirillales bacterium 69-11]
MTDIATTARAFFDACETGQGWAACAPFCTPDATFAAQAEPLAEVKTLQAYCDWMTMICGLMPDARYELRAWAEDADRHCVIAFAVFHGTHTGAGGPVPPTGRSVQTDYVYARTFTGEKISHMTKVWNASWAMRALGWAD